MPEAYIRGNTIKYLRVPDEVIDKVKDDSLNRAGGASHHNAASLQTANLLFQLTACFTTLCPDSIRINTWCQQICCAMQKSGQWQAQEVGEGAGQVQAGEMVLGVEGVLGVQGRRLLDEEKVHLAGEVCCRKDLDLDHNCTCWPVKCTVYVS